MNNDEIKTKAFSGVIWKFMERFIAQGVSLIVSIIIARILSPTEYSIVGIVTVFFNFANIFITSGLNTALVQKKDSDRLDYSTVLWASLLLSIVVFLILFFSAPTIAGLYQMEILIVMIRVMALSLPVTAIKSIWCAYISSNLLFKKFFFATFGGTIVSGAVGIYMALHGYGAWALIAQQMTNTLIDTLILVLSTRIRMMLSFSISRLKELFRYGWKIFVSAVIATLYTEVSPLIIGLKFSSADLAYYTKGKSFPSMLSTTSTSTLSAVLFPVLAKYQDDKKRIREYTRQFMRVSSFVIFSVMLGFFSVSENFVSVILTDKWLPSVYYIRIFCLCNMFDVIAIGNCETIKAIGRSDVYLKMEIVKKTCYFIILALFISIAPSAKVLAVAYIACTVVQILVNSIPNIQLINYRVKEQLIDLAPNLGISIIMCISTMFVGKLLPHNLWSLIIQILVGLCIFIVLCLITHNQSFRYIVTFVKSRVRLKNEKRRI